MWISERKTFREEEIAHIKSEDGGLFVMTKEW